MTCYACGSKTWNDDELRWAWCYNPQCHLHFSHAERRGYYEAVDAMQEYYRQQAAENMSEEEYYSCYPNER